MSFTTSVMLCLIAAGAQAQMYSSGIGKATHLVSDAPAALSWFTHHLPVSHDTAGLHCTAQPGDFNETFCPCGQAGRVSLWCIECPPCAGCQPWGKQGGFGLHTLSYDPAAPHIVRPPPRPIDAGGIGAIEAQVTRKLRAAAATGGYDALLDFSTGFWVGDLDPYVREFGAAAGGGNGNGTGAGYNTLPLEWRDDANNATYYSLVVQVANRTFDSFVLLEFMSARQTLLPSARYVSPTPRFLFAPGQGPADVFPPLNVTAGPGNKPLPRPARLSHYSSNLTRDRDFYELVLGRPRGAPELSGLDRGGAGQVPVPVPVRVRSVVYNFSDMSTAPNYMQLWLTQRDLDPAAGAATGSGLTVADVEETMHAVHDAALTSDVCGYDQYMDFHYGVSTRNWRALDVVIPEIEKLGGKYHTGTSTWHPPVPGPNGTVPELLTLFAVTPNGITVQLHNMKRGAYTPSRPPVEGHDGLCSLGPAGCPAPAPPADIIM
eukprot:g2565.t1